MCSPIVVVNRATFLTWVLLWSSIVHTLPGKKKRTFLYGVKYAKCIKVDYFIYLGVRLFLHYLSLDELCCLEKDNVCMDKVET